MSTITIKTPKIYPHQRSLVDCYDNHPHDSIITVKAKRQIGKTTVCQLLALRQCINYSNQILIIMEPTYKQCTRVFRELVQMIKNIPVFEAANKGELIIEFKNGSQICFYSGSTDDTLRGPHITKNSFLLIDEAVFIKDSVIYQMLPTVDANHAAVILISTPKFQQGAFWEFYKRGLENESGFYSLDWSKFDTSMFLSPEKLEMYRKSLPYPVFACEYLGEFITSYSELFGDLDKICSNDFDKQAPCEVMAIDWSGGHATGDYTAVTAFNSFKQQCFLEYFNTEKPTQQIDHLLKIVKQLRPKKIVVEMNGAGEVHADHLKKAIRQNGIVTSFIEFITTNESKRNIYDNLIVAATNGELQFLDDPMEKLQLAGITTKSTKTGKITYENDNPATHDDIPDSLAMAYYYLSKSTNYVFGSAKR